MKDTTQTWIYNEYTCQATNSYGTGQTVIELREASKSTALEIMSPLLIHCAYVPFKIMLPLLIPCAYMPFKIMFPLLIGCA